MAQRDSPAIRVRISWDGRTLVNCPRELRNAEFVVAMRELRGKLPTCWRGCDPALSVLSPRFGTTSPSTKISRPPDSISSRRSSAACGDRFFHHEIGSGRWPSDTGQIWQRCLSSRLVGARARFPHSCPKALNPGRRRDLRIAGDQRKVKRCGSRGDQAVTAFCYCKQTLGDVDDFGHGTICRTRPTSSPTARSHRVACRREDRQFRRRSARSQST